MSEAAWIERARRAHRSVAHFSELSLQLMALGSGPELLFAVHQAAIDAVKVTNACFAAASFYAGKTIEPGALPPRDDELDAAIGPARLAALCVVAGHQHAVAAEQTTDSDVQVMVDACALIAKHGAEHARLCWDIVGYCIEVGGDEVRSALRAMILPSGAGPELQARVAAWLAADADGAPESDGGP